jgi:hypothetical protein
VFDEETWAAAFSPSFVLRREPLGPFEALYVADRAPRACRSLMAS